MWMFVLAIAVVVILVLSAAISLDMSKSNAVQSDLQERLLELIDIHSATLARKRSQLRYFDDYKVERLDKWKSEAKSFFSGVILQDPQCRDLRLQYNEHSKGPDSVLTDGDFFEMVYDLIESKVPLCNQQSDQVSYSTDLTGDEYEAYCAAKLEAAGWSVVRTGRTGDQGVDLIANKDDKRVAIQCKHYSSPVGNAAVQEVISGKVFEGANYAVVVSNAPYTVAAQQLASSAEVSLLHHDQLPNLDKVVEHPNG